MGVLNGLQNPTLRTKGIDTLGRSMQNDQITKGSLSYLSSPCFSKNVLQSGVGIVH